MSKGKEQTDVEKAVKTVDNPPETDSAEVSAADENAVKSDAGRNDGFSCYIGPNLPGIIQTGTIYPVGREDALMLPELVLALARKPGIADLVVDGDALAEGRMKVKRPGEPLYQAYRAVMKQ